MPDNKLPGNDGLTKEFYKTFWEESSKIKIKKKNIKIILYNYINKNSFV